MCVLGARLWLSVLESATTILTVVSALVRRRAAPRDDGVSSEIIPETQNITGRLQFGWLRARLANKRIVDGARLAKLHWKVWVRGAINMAEKMEENSGMNNIRLDMLRRASR